MGEDPKKTFKKMGKEKRHLQGIANVWSEFGDASCGRKAVLEGGRKTYWTYSTQKRLTIGLFCPPPLFGMEQNLFYLVFSFPDKTTPTTSISSTALPGSSCRALSLIGIVLRCVSSKLCLDLARFSWLLTSVLAF